MQPNYSQYVYSRPKSIKGSFWGTKMCMVEKQNYAILYVTGKTDFSVFVSFSGFRLQLWK